jgi:hypothetical protein
LGKNNFGDMLFELKDNLNNETIYAVETSYSVKFILVPYFENIKDRIKSNKFISTRDFSADKVPLRKTNGELYVGKNSEWNGELTILRKKDITIVYDESNNKPQESDQDIRYMVILSQKNDTIIIPLNGTDNDKGQWGLEDVFTVKNNFEKQKAQNQNDEKLKVSNLIKKYGEKFGKLVYQKKMTIGMSKDMCSDIYGITLNRKKYKNASGEIEVWEYTGMAKLYFKNGKLNEIINY